MEKVKVRKKDLLKKLKENRDKHNDIFKKAQEGYRAKTIELLDNALKDAQEGREIKNNFHLQAPVNQIKDYDRAIAMLDMSVDDSIELTEHEFAEYVMDDWHWKRQFTVTNSAYLAQ